MESVETVHESSKLSSILTHQCPGCRSTSMFENPRLYSWTNFSKVKESCEKCGTNLKPEAGFYFGAAYANWALTVALWVAVLVALIALDSLGVITYGFTTHPLTFLLSGLVCTLVFFPYMYRLSRAMWAHMHIGPVGARHGEKVK